MINKGLSFDYSFMWGDESFTTMSDATDNSPTGISSDYSNVDCDTVRPNLDGIDSDGVMNQPQWIIGLNQCNMESTMPDETVTEYHLYWNPNPLPGDVIFGLMNQVRFKMWFSSGLRILYFEGQNNLQGGTLYGTSE